MRPGQRADVESFSRKRRLGYLSAAPRVSTRPEAEAGGPRAHVLGIMRAFEVLGWEVKPFIVGDRVSRRWVGKGSQRAISAGFFRTLVVDLVRLFMGVVNARRAWRELGGEVDWVYERFATLQSLGWIFKRHGIPWILETNAPLFSEAKEERKSLVLGPVARWLELRAYRGCDVLVCISEELKDFIVREAGIRPDKVLVVPNGVDTVLFDPERCEPRVLFDGFSVGFVGSLNPWQGLGSLLEVMRDLREEGIEVSLVVVGDGLMRSSWEGLARKLGLSDRVAFVGRVSWAEVPAFIAGLDLGYSGHLRSQSGTMYHSPLKIYEYMAMGKPVLASAFGDARRAIRDGETGFLFEAGDKEDLKRAMIRAYRSRETLPEMGSRAREEISANHGWVARVRDLVEGARRILGERGWPEQDR